MGSRTPVKQPWSCKQMGMMKNYLWQWLQEEQLLEKTGLSDEGWLVGSSSCCLVLGNCKVFITKPALQGDWGGCPQMHSLTLWHISNYEKCSLSSNFCSHFIQLQWDLVDFRQKTLIKS